MSSSIAFYSATSLNTCFSANLLRADILTAGKELDLAQMQMDSDRVNRIAAILIKDWATVFSVRRSPRSSRSTRSHA